MHLREFPPFAQRQLWGERGEMNYIFYNTETTGTNTAFDQILQFAAIYTDEHLQELDRFEIRSRILPWVVPHPKVLQVIGIDNCLRRKGYTIVYLGA